MSRRWYPGIRLSSDWPRALLIGLSWKFDKATSQWTAHIEERDLRYRLSFCMCGVGMCRSPILITRSHPCTRSEKARHHACLHRLGACICIWAASPRRVNRPPYITCMFFAFVRSVRNLDETPRRTTYRAPAGPPPHPKLRSKDSNLQIASRIRKRFQMRTNCGVNASIEMSHARIVLPRSQEPPAGAVHSELLQANH